METINVSKLKSKISEILRHVRGGVDYSIYDRSSLVAILTRPQNGNNISVQSSAKEPFSPPISTKVSTKIDPVQFLLEDRLKR